MPLSPTDLRRAYRALSAALDGSGPPVEFTADGQVLHRPHAAAPAAGGQAGVAAVVRTSGSTGVSKQTLLAADALAASSTATAQRIGEHGQWLLALGLQYVAGLAVLSRSIHAGTVPVALPPGPFTTERFHQAAAQLPDTGFHAVSLVPAQLARLLDPHPGRQGVDALRRFDAILVGGARVPEVVRERAAEAGLPLHLTYGMSETCGGCVYDGVPLDGMSVDVVPDPESGPPRLRLAGPMVAAGYFRDPERTAAHFGTGTATAPTARWYLTEDTGTVTGPAGGPRGSDSQRITVAGRVDDVINTGGVKVSAAQIEQVLEQVAGVSTAFAAGIPDDEWGQRVCAAVASPVAGGPQPTVTELQDHLAEAVREALGPAAVPKLWLILDTLPLLPNGKADRQQLLQRMASP